jgi:hypothetical protein
VNLRSRTSAPSALATLIALAVALAGCERGCLSTWLAEHGAGAGDPSGARPGTPGFGGSGPRGSGGRDSAAATLDLGGTDCSDGLARCSAGQVEVSIAGHVPHPCAAPKETPGACACPWQPAGACAAGCVKEGLEVVAAPEIAREQLCAADAMTLRPATIAESAVVTICADESVACVEGMVRICPARGQPARLAGACVNGCATGISVDQGDDLTGDGVAAILCRRAHAERR